MKNPSLEFLMTDLSPEEREAITRAYYDFAQGDSRSYPVGLAVLLTACARKITEVPESFKETYDLQKKLILAFDEKAVLMTEAQSKAALIVAELVANRTQLETVLHTAIDKIDVEELRQKFDSALANTVSKTDAATKTLIRAGETAEAQMKKLQAFHFLWVSGVALVSGLALASGLFIWQWQRLAGELASEKTRQVEAYGKAFTILAQQNRQLRVATGNNGDVYFTISNAKNAFMSDGGVGVIQIQK